MPASYEIDSMPDINRLQRLIRKELAAGLVLSGQAVITDCTKRIADEVDLDGQPQRRNSPKYAAWKLKHKGHEIPLRKDDVLSNRRNYLMNNQPFGQRVTPPKNLVMTLKLPPTRVATVAKLLTQFTPPYRVPWGISQRAKKLTMRLLTNALRLAIARWEGRPNG